MDITAYNYFNKRRYHYENNKKDDNIGGSFCCALFKGCAEVEAMYSCKLLASEIDFIGKKTIADFLRDHQYEPSHFCMDARI